MTIRKKLKGLGIYKNEHEDLFVASIDNFYAQYITSRARFHSLKTFNDGTANIFKHSSYYVQKHDNVLKSNFKFFLGLSNYNISNIKNYSNLHYTIFKEVSNIIEEVEYINIFSKKLLGKKVEEKGVFNLILGQSLNQFIGDEKYYRVIREMVSHFDIDAYFPHPRESLNLEGLIENIHTYKIFEDYLLDKLEIGFQCFELYTFFSGSVLTLKDLEGVKVRIIYNDLLIEKFKDSYIFLENRGFTLISLKE